jgi:DNA-directed RNA polymerase specialized sigma24 family protein
MLIDQRETRTAVRQIVFRLTIDRALQEDLTQEAFIHLWLREQQRPDQSQSWYFQSCRFFLQNYLRNGRSVHSNRHHQALCSTTTTAGYDGISGSEPLSDDSVRAQVSAREIISLLATWLTPLERQLLNCLAEGFGLRESAARLKLSHTWVIRCRRRIAALAVKLGIEPLPDANGRRRHSERRSRATSPK